MTRLIYLHGFASGPRSTKAQYFKKLMEDAGAQVAVPDLAAGDFENLTITGQLAVIDNLAEGGPVSLIGSSLGGYLAALYAARHPSVQRLVLLAPGFGFAQHWPARLGPVQVAAWRHAGSMPVYHYGDKRQRLLGYQLLADGERYEAYPQFTQPALIFHGTHDDIVPAAFSREFAASHPNITLEVLDSGHDLLNMLDYMAPKVATFLAD